MNDGAVALLEKAVMGWNGRPTACALERLRHARGNSPTLLSVVAEAVGFSVSEAHGIMDGWDEGLGHPSNFNDYPEDYPLDYAMGADLGRRMFRLVGPSPVGT